MHDHHRGMQDALAFLCTQVFTRADYATYSLKHYPHFHELTLRYPHTSSSQRRPGQQTSWDIILNPTARFAQYRAYLFIGYVPVACKAKAEAALPDPCPCHYAVAAMARSCTVTLQLRIDLGACPHPRTVLRAQLARLTGTAGTVHCALRHELLPPVQPWSDRGVFAASRGAAA